MIAFRCVAIDSETADRSEQPVMTTMAMYSAGSSPQALAVSRAATACGSPALTDNEIAPIVFANELVSVRAYDADDQCLYDLGEVCEGASVQTPLLRALEDPRTSFVNIHTARPGCLLTRVERLSAAL